VAPTFDKKQSRRGKSEKRSPKKLTVAQVEIKNQKASKSRNKAPNPILREIRGFTYTHIHKAVFSVIENPFLFRYVCPLGCFYVRCGFFAAFLVGRDHNKSPVFFLEA
jgi:hypothetical protein